MATTLRRKIGTRDGERGEVRVERGVGRVVRVLRDANGPTARVEIVPESDDPNGQPLLASHALAHLGNPAVTEALADDPIRRRVEYVIETHRNKGIDTALPISAVLNGDKARWLTMLRFLPEVGEPHPTSPKPTVNVETPPAPRPSGTSQVDTWAFNAALSCTLDAADIMHTQTAGRWNPEAVEWIAVALAAAADFAQQHATGTINRNVHSHNRARGAVHLVARHNPPPDSWAKQDVYAWAYGLAGRAAQLMSIAQNVAGLA